MFCSNTNYSSETVFIVHLSVEQHENDTKQLYLFGTGNKKSCTCSLFHLTGDYCMFMCCYAYASSVALTYFVHMYTLYIYLYIFAWSHCTYCTRLRCFPDSQLFALLPNTSAFSMSGARLSRMPKTSLSQNELNCYKKKKKAHGKRPIYNCIGNNVFC